MIKLLGTMGTIITLSALISSGIFAANKTHCGNVIAVDNVMIGPNAKGNFLISLALKGQTVGETFYVRQSNETAINMALISMSNPKIRVCISSDVEKTSIVEPGLASAIALDFND